MAFKVAIVGRPNVGKSSLFNKIIGHRKAVVDFQAGSTRDRLYSAYTWNNKTYQLIDTGGIEFEGASFEFEIKHQVEIAILEADLILFLTDGKTGLLDQDYKIANILYKKNKPILLCVNKIDDIQQMSNIYEFYSLGLGDPISISSTHGIGIGDLLDKIQTFNNKKDYEYKEVDFSVCIIGKPNVGKSSLLNTILGYERTITSNIAGTTRDSIDEIIEKENYKIRLVDTAGIRKPSKVVLNNEKYSVIRAMDSLEKADVAVLVLDATRLEIQDQHVAGLIKDSYKAVVICVNKWDLINADTNTMKEMKEKILEQFNFIDYAEIVFLSALENKRVHTLFPAIIKAWNNYNKQLSTSILNNLLTDITFKYPAKNFNGGSANFSYIVQTATKPPTLLIFVNNPDWVHFSYQRYLQNEFRKNIELTGCPLKLEFRKKE